MSGFWSLDENDRDRTIKPLTEYATRNSNGQWIAGPKAKGYSEGQFIPTKMVTFGGDTREVPAENVGRQYTLRRRNNLVKAVMRASDVPEEEARQKTTQMLEELAKAETDAEKKEIWQKYGSP